jgi:lipopolysaccharide/colanic/teichoic acid biosynthesis glycosyltransferase
MYRYLKRLLDIAVSGAALVFLAPVLLVVATLVWIKLGSPILYRQIRPGYRGEPFELIKFRSMLDAYDAEGNALPNAERMTSFGNFLRHSSLDELPEFWNILMGDMSVVGPRPLLMEYLTLYSNQQRRRHEVLPGLTGWCQVNGRNALSWDEKFELDVWYVDHASLLLDVRIILMTIFQVLRREGITHEGDVAMPRFRGSDTSSTSVTAAEDKHCAS